MNVATNLEKKMAAQEGIIEQQADVITQQSVSIASLENRIQYLEIKVGFL